MDHEDKVTIRGGHLLSLRAISCRINEGRDTDDYSWDTVASQHQVKGFTVCVEDQDDHPEKLYALQTHPAKGCQVEEMQQPCHHRTANLVQSEET